MYSSYQIDLHLETASKQISRILRGILEQNFKETHYDSA